MQLSQYTIEQLIKGVEKLEIYPNEIQEAIEREQKPLYWIEQFHTAAYVAMVGYAMTAKQYSGAVDEALQELEAILERLVIAGGVCSNSNIQAFAMGNAAKVQAVRNAIAPDRKQHKQEQSTDSRGGSTDNDTAPESPLKLPGGLHTDEAVKVFEAAIKAGNGEAKQTEAPQKPQNKQRGRKVKPFVGYLLGDEAQKTATLKALHTLLQGKSGKDVVLILRAAVTAGKMTKPTFKAVENEYGDIGSQQNYDKFMNNERAFYEDEIQGVITALENQK